MSNWKSFWGSVGLLAATTIGAGMFSLPYVFKESGWLTGIFYLVVLGAAIVFVHYIYWLALARVNEKERVLGLVRDKLGAAAFYMALVSIIVGLLFTLVIYLILAQNFGKMILPAPLKDFGAALFWAAVSIPLFLKLARFVEAEFLATSAKILVALFVFLLAGRDGLSAAPLISADNFLLPFGAVLFSLAGWTAVEPIFEWQRRNGDSKPLAKLALGTFLSAAVYVLFIIGVLAAGGGVSANIFSGPSWSSWEIQIFALLGILAIWTPYVPVSLEIKNGLEKDLRLPKFLSFAAVIILPPAVFLSGFFNFLEAIGLVGGVFLAMQYIFIIMVSKKILGLSGAKKIIANLLIFVFLAAAVYEVYYFAIK